MGKKVYLIPNNTSELPMKDDRESENLDKPNMPSMLQLIGIPTKRRQPW